MKHSKRSYDHDELRRLLAATCSETLTESDRTRLNQILNEHPAARRYYLDYMEIHGRLSLAAKSLESASTYTEQTDQSVSDAADSADMPIAVPLSALDTAEDSRAATFTSSVAGFALLAAIVLLTVTFLYTNNRRGDIAKDESARAKATTKPRVVRKLPIVAEVTGVADCRWADGTNKENGFPVAAGQTLDLLEGVAEITYRNGARVILQAPVEYELKSVLDSYLHGGSLSVAVPKDVERFTIDTPGTRLVDLSTEFGTTVNPSGQTELYVFAGNVRADLKSVDLDDGTSPGTVLVGQNEARRFDSREQKVETIEMKPNRFLRHIESTTVVYSIRADRQDCRLADVDGDGFGDSVQRDSMATPIIGVGERLGSKEPDSQPGRWWLPFAIGAAERKRILRATTVMLDVSLLKQNATQKQSVDLYVIKGRDHAVALPADYEAEAELVAANIVTGTTPNQSRNSIDVTDVVKQAARDASEFVVFRVQVHTALPHIDGQKNCFVFFTANDRRGENLPTLTVTVP